MRNNNNYSREVKTTKMEVVTENKTNKEDNKQKTGFSESENGNCYFIETFEDLT